MATHFKKQLSYKPTATPNEAQNPIYFSRTKREKCETKRFLLFCCFNIHEKEQSKKIKD